MRAARSIATVASASASSHCSGLCNHGRCSFHSRSASLRRLSLHALTQGKSFADTRGHQVNQKPWSAAPAHCCRLREGVGCIHSSVHDDQEKSPLGSHKDDTCLQNKPPSSAYVHLPFCKRRCFYCDFAIVAVGERHGTNTAHVDSSMDSYTKSVCTEIASTLKKLPEVIPLKTLFFGGGTPSLLPAHHLSSIIEVFEQCCGFESTAEVSMEMDPGTFDRTSMKDFLKCGVNRVSLGVQAFNDGLLKACGRSHVLKDVYEAIGIIQDLDVRNWSLDLISSLPHQTIQLWEESVCKAIDLGPPHISIYDLQIEEGTKFGSWYKPGQHPLPNEDSSAEFYRLASSLLKEAGYEHYEISNYAKPGFQCSHNLVYWRNQPYYGFGLGATSYLHGTRFSRPKKWKEYADFVAGFIPQEVNDNLLVKSQHENATGNAIDRLSDTIMLSLRLAQGLDLHFISQTFGHDWCSHILEAFVPFIHSGHAVALDSKLAQVSSDVFVHEVSQGLRTQNKDIMSIRLTDPEGFLVSNEIISTLFSTLPNV